MGKVTGPRELPALDVFHCQGAVLDLCRGDRVLHDLLGSDAVLWQLEGRIADAADRDEQRYQGDNHRRRRTTWTKATHGSSPVDVPPHLPAPRPKAQAR